MFEYAFWDKEDILLFRAHPKAAAAAAAESGKPAAPEEEEQEQEEGGRTRQRVIALRRCLRSPLLLRLRFPRRRVPRPPAPEGSG